MVTFFRRTKAWGRILNGPPNALAHDDPLRADIGAEIDRNAGVLRRLTACQEDYKAVKANDSRAALLSQLKAARDKMFVGNQSGILGDNAPYSVRLERTHNLLARMQPIVAAKDLTRQKGEVQKQIRIYEVQQKKLQSMTDYELRNLLDVGAS